jgi:FAD:protein FMN transferase
VLLPAYLPEPRLRPLRSEHFIERWSWAMGQPVHLQLFAASKAQGYDAAALALAELRRVESRLTLFDDTSDLCELNRRAGGRAMQAGEDLTFVLSRAMAFKHATAGAFDIAVEPLMRAWGFHSPRKTEPTPAEIAGAREAVARAQVILSSGRARLPSSTTLLDLGGIGVGYGLDRAAGVLRRLGIERAFLDVSGDCIAIGTPPNDEKGWTVEIAGPARGSGIVGETRLRDAALATSANTMSVVHYGRAVRGHVMDPKTGWPAETMVQVSVKARTGIEADALSTAMLVSGRSAPGVVWNHQVKSEK